MLRQHDIFVFDFDHTLINANSDTAILELAPDLNEWFEAWHNEHPGQWTKLMSSLFMVSEYCKALA